MTSKKMYFKVFTDGQTCLQLYSQFKNKVIDEITLILSDLPLRAYVNILSFNKVE